MNAKECPELTTLKTETGMFAWLGMLVQRRVVIGDFSTRVTRLYKHCRVLISVKYAESNASFPAYLNNIHKIYNYD